MKTQRRLMAMIFITGVAILGMTSASGQSPATGAGAGKSFTKKNSFKLPVKIDVRERAKLRDIQLYVKAGPTDTWKLYQTAVPTQTEFKFTAPQDGEFWFKVVTTDQQGKQTPPDVGKEGPGLVVVVDSQVPECEIHPFTGHAGELLLQCEIQDAHPEPSKSRLEYQSADKQWQLLDQQAGHPGYFRVPDAVLLRGMVRAIVCDQAGNTTTREFNLSNLATLPASTASALPVSAVPTQSAVAPTVPGTVVVPAQSVMAPAATAPAAPVTSAPVVTTPQAHNVASVVPNVPAASLTGSPAVPLQTATPVIPATCQPIQPCSVSVQVPAAIANQCVTTPASTPATPAPAALAPSCKAVATPPLQLVNHKHVSLDYQIDQAVINGVGKVDVWITNDEGQTWQYLCQDLDRRSPVEVDLPGEGLYGVALVLCGGNVSQSPAKGEIPDLWVEIDSTKPAAQLLAVRQGAAREEMGTCLITWTATDKNLKSEPIDLFFATRKEGPWMPLVRGLKNDGTFRWQMPQGVNGEVFVRMEVTDQAGNVTRSDLAPGASADGARPRARVIGVTASHRLTPPTGN